jgi:hypothetical protein
MPNFPGTSPVSLKVEHKVHSRALEEPEQSAGRREFATSPRFCFVKATPAAGGEQPFAGARYF